MNAPATAAAPARRIHLAWKASSSCLLGSAFTDRGVCLTALVEVELGQRALVHVGGHLPGDLEIARADGDVIEADDPGEPSSLHHRQPVDLVEHQRRR